MTIDTKEFRDLLGDLRYTATLQGWNTGCRALITFIDAKLSTARSAGLEEAAKLSESMEAFQGWQISKHIRALATQPAPLDQQASTELDERALFEAWFAPLFGQPKRLGDSDQYQMGSAQGAWQAWQARATLAHSASTPTAPTEAMIDAFIEFTSKGGYLSHPDVPYQGTVNGDSEELWRRRMAAAAIRAVLKSTQAAQGGGVQAAYDALRFYVDASDVELAERGISRADALRLARDAESALAANPAPSAAPVQDSDARRRAFIEIGEKMRANVRPDELAKFVDAEILKPRAAAAQVAQAGAGSGAKSTETRMDAGSHPGAGLAQLAEAPSHAARDGGNNG